jgi:RNA polymerase sigma factor (sigma-70 family)
MMEAVRVPPFERFYRDHADAVYGFLVGRVGRERADDAFQDTFLKALAAYGRLEHGKHLRAWVFTIAARVALDEYRRSSRIRDVTSGESFGTDPEPPWEELADLTDGLPTTERAAVVLRYGYDMSYADIGAMLGSSEDAARQAASSGVRRLRRRMR